MLGRIGEFEFHLMTCKSFHRTALLVACLILSGCSDKDTRQTQTSTEGAPQQLKVSAPTTEAQLAELMKAVFGDKYNAAKSVAVGPLPDLEVRDETATYSITAHDSTMLPTGETVLLANALLVDQYGEVVDSHAASGLLNLYVLRKKSDQWEVIRRHENIDALGSFGNLGSSRWIQLGQGRTGLAMTHGGTWQGYTIEILDLYDISNGDVRKLTKEGINMHSDNSGGCSPEVECWDVSGKWTLEPTVDANAYPDLMITFTGEERDIVEGAEREAKPINMKARYRFDGSAYKLVEGANPARSF